MINTIIIKALIFGFSFLFLVFGVMVFLSFTNCTIRLMVVNNKIDLDLFFFGRAFKIDLDKLIKRNKAKPKKKLKLKRILKKTKITKLTICLYPHKIIDSAIVDGSLFIILIFLKDILGYYFNEVDDIYLNVSIDKTNVSLINLEANLKLKLIYYLYSI